MKSYYRGRHAVNYNRVWKTFNERTLSATLASIERALPTGAQGWPRRILDVGCGTGLLLDRLAERFPSAELTGIEISPDMLAQARQGLQGRVRVHLVQGKLGARGEVLLPFAPGTFDLITCTNTLHYFPDLLAVLESWSVVLEERGHMVIEDYLLRSAPLPVHLFEWAVKLYDPQHVRLYQPSTVRSLIQLAGFQMLDMQGFSIDLVFHGWVLHLQR